MEDLSFAKRDKEVDLYIPVEQLSHIIIVDNSCLSLDGSNGQRGGHPKAVFYCPSLLNPGRDMDKSSMTNTLITGSTAAREAIPLRFQFGEVSNSGDREIEG